MGNGGSFPGVKLLGSRLRMSGAITMLSLYAFTSWLEETLPSLPLPLHCYLLHCIILKLLGKGLCVNGAPPYIFLRFFVCLSSFRPASIIKWNARKEKQVSVLLFICSFL